MRLSTIGTFARETGLSQKALRLYDRLGLLAPAAVDPETGYRLYGPGQVRHARLIGELRRIGMPLADIRAVCELPPDAAATAVEAYWRKISAETAERARVAALLVDHLSGRDTTMTDDIRHATRCVTGKIRKSNEDSAYAGSRLLAVADGGGGPAGAAAGRTAIDALRALENVDLAPSGLLAAVADAVAGADRSIRATATEAEQPITTLTALVRSGNRLALAHVGDTRAYLLRGGELTQLTQDHTWAQSQIDAGKLGRDEAWTHPQRALLVRALGAGREGEADLALRTAVPGDRYLLCSDGLSAVVERSSLYAALVAAGDPEEAVEALVGLAEEAGAPDNIACVVADFPAAT